MVINALNGVNENWNIFEHKTKIMIYLTKLHENLTKNVF